MSLLSIVQSATKRLGLNTPTAIASATDPAVLQLMELLNEEGKDLSQRTNWQALTAQATFTTVATETQGALSTIAPGCKFIINDTIWKRTLRRPVFGPLIPQQWQQMKAMFMQGPWNQYRVRLGNIDFVPAPTAGQSCFFEYVTKNWCSNGTDAFTADADTSLLDEEIMTLGLIWRWRAAKGLDYASDYDKYDDKVQNAMGRDASKPILNAGDVRYDILPGVFVPSGSWGV